VDRPGTSRETDQLRALEAPVGLTEQERQNPLLDRVKEPRRDWRRRRIPY
jgi:hypothetical protein